MRQRQGAFRFARQARAVPYVTAGRGGKSGGVTGGKIHKEIIARVDYIDRSAGGGQPSEIFQGGGCQ